MPRALWKGAISFSLIHIPVRLFTATRANELDLDMLDKRDFSPIGYKRTNKKTGRAVEWDDIVRGYQYEKGKYVVLTPGDFRRANVEATQTIDIHAFTERDAIPPYFFETPYYLGPDKGGAKVFRLLHDALVKSRKIGVASVVIRTRQHLAALMPLDDIIQLDTLRFADEVLDPAKVVPRANGTRATSARATAASPRELQMALRLIEEMSEPWKPERYHDSYREDLMKRIEEKIASGETHELTEDVAPRRAESGKVVDLMALLRESLDQKQGRASGDRSSGRRSSYGRRRVSRTRGRRPARRA
jgi:DNA end-binding protein Ku